MSRRKHTASNRICPENSPEQNLDLAQLGEFAESEAFSKAYAWRLRLLMSRFTRNKKHGEKIRRQIGEWIAPAIETGNARLIEELAKAMRYLNERCDWNAKTPQDFIDLIGMDERKLKPVDAVRFLVAHYFFFVGGGPFDRAKKTKAGFRKLIDDKLPDVVDEKTFNRACAALGIRWNAKKKDNSRLGTVSRKRLKV